MAKLILTKKDTNEVIEAFQYTGTNDFEMRQWSNGKVYPSPVLEPTEHNPRGDYLQIETRRGIDTAILSDWITKDKNNEFKKYTAKEFRATFIDNDWIITNKKQEEVKNQCTCYSTSFNSEGLFYLIRHDCPIHKGKLLP